jgi:hypothetical protein
VLKLFFNVLRAGGAIRFDPLHLLLIRITNLLHFRLVFSDELLYPL